MTNKLGPNIGDIITYADRMLKVLDENKEPWIANPEGSYFKEDFDDHQVTYKIYRLERGEKNPCVDLLYGILTNPPLMPIQARIEPKGRSLAGLVRFVCNFQVEGYDTLPYGNLTRHSREIPDCDIKKLRAAISDLRGHQ